MADPNPAQAERLRQSALQRAAGQPPLVPPRQTSPATLDPQAAFGNSAVADAKTRKADTPAKPTTAQRFPHWPKPEYAFKFRHLLALPFLRHVLGDLIRPLTQEEQKEFGLTGGEQSAFFSWLLAVPFAIEGLGGHPGVAQMPDYAKSLHKLSPGGHEILDIFSIIFQRRVDKYLGSELFGARWKGHLASMVSLGLIGQGLYSGMRAATKPNAPKGEMVPEEWSRHVAQYWSTVLSAILGPMLAASEDFDRGPLLVPTHRFFGEAPFAGRQPFSGVKLEGLKGMEAEQGGSQLKAAFTVNVAKIIAPPKLKISRDDVDDPEIYPGPQLTGSLSYERLRPTADMAKLGQRSYEALAYGFRTGFGRQRFLYEAGERSHEGATTLRYDKLGYAYKLGRDQSVGATALVTRWNEHDVLAPGRGASAAELGLAGQAFQLTPFLRLKFGDRTSFSADLSATIITSSLESFGLTDARVDLAFIHRGNRTLGQIPLLKIQLAAVMRRQDPLDPKSKIFPGGELRFHYGKLFLGGQFMSGGEGVAPWRAAQSGVGVTPERPWSLLGTIGWLK